MDKRANNQRVLDNHGNITQFGSIYEINNANFFNINIPHDLELYIRFFKKFTENSKNYKIVVSTSILSPIEDIDKLFEKVEEFIYSLEDLNLQLITYHQNNKDKLPKYNSIAENKIIQELEKYIYSQKKEYFENKINSLNYTKFCSLIKDLNKFKSAQENYELNIEYETIQLTNEFFKNNLLPIEHCNSKDYFEFLENSNIDYNTKSFKATSIINYLNYKRNICDSFFKDDWDALYKEIQDTDFRIISYFLFLNDKYEKNISGLKKYILDHNLISEMYNDIEGMKPYSLYDICNLKSLFDYNNVFWASLINNYYIQKEFEEN